MQQRANFFRCEDQTKGWDFVLTEILPSLAERSAFAKEICAAVEEATMERAAGSGIAKAGPRRRQRRRVGRRSTCGMGVPLRCRTVLRSSSDQRAARHPWPVRATSRGRMRELIGEMLRQAHLRATSVSGTSAGSPLRDPLLGGVRGCTSMPFVSDRLALPDSAAVVKLRPWLSGPTAEAWENPGTFDPESAPKAHFAASQREWRKVVRRMVRCGLARSLPGNTLPPRCAAGAFAVKKDEHADRLIGDRRPLNAGERQPGPVRLPYASRLRWMQLPWGKGIWVAKRDLSNHFYLCEVDPSRLERQVIGPRIPRSWLHDVENGAEDDRVSFEGWFTPDLNLSAADMGVNVDESTFCQVALSGVMMGDVGAVAVIQEAHTRVLLATGCSSLRS